MSRTPEEAKQGLEHCINGTSCRGCPYCEDCAIATDCNPMHKDLQEYIQRLESGLSNLAEAFATLREQAEKLEAENSSKIKRAYWLDDAYCSNCRAAKPRPNAAYLEPKANTFCHECGYRMDAEMPKHAKWSYNNHACGYYMSGYVCSACLAGSFEQLPECPKCHAIMDAKEEEHGEEA